MAAKRKPVRRVTTEYVERGDEDEREPDRLSVADERTDETYHAFIGKFGARDGVMVKVYRQTERGKQYCFLGPPDEIDEEAIRLYHSRQPYAHEEGDYRATVFIHGEPQDSFPIPIAPQVAAPGAQNGGHGGMASYDVLRMLQAQNERLETRLLSLQQHERTPINELADAMLKLQAMQQNTQQGPDKMEWIMKAVELGQKMGPQASDDWMGLLKDAVPYLGPAIGAIFGRTPSAIAQQQNAVPGGDVAAQTEEQRKARFKQLIEYLKKKVLARSDPGLYIDILIDNQAEPEYADLIHRIATEDFSVFTSVCPEISQPPFEAWFRFVYDGIRRAIEESNQMAAATTGDGGNEADVENNVKPRKVGGKKS